MAREAPARTGGLGRALRRGAEALIVALFTVIVGVFALSIVSRYAFNRPVAWADEVLILAMVWCTFLAGALVLEEREQVVFDLLYARRSPQARRALLGLGSVLLAALLAAALPGILGYTLFLWRERTNVLELRLDVAYSCFAFFIVALIVRRLWLVASLLRADWRDALRRIEDPAAPDPGPAR